MKVVNDIWRQLKSRRLLPVAVILVGALAAVPFVLAKEPETVAQPALEPVDESATQATKTIVTTASTDSTGRKVIGEKANPFQSDELPKAKSETTGPKAQTSDTVGLDDPVGGSGDTPAGGGTPTTTPGGGTPTAPTAPTTPTEPGPAPKSYDKYDLTVRFGASDTGDLKRMTLPRLQPLPKDDLPAVLYLGVSKDGKSAIFLLEKGVEAVGDGNCAPTPEDCETLRLRVGETEFLDVVDEEGNVTSQYQLDLVKIHKATTSSAAAASASSKRGRELLARRAGSSGRPAYRFDASSGTLERRPGAVGAVARTTASIG